ncbi:MAG: zinc ribbon domain-containing protein [Bacillota bacterium]|nr:zinc ribbon domain-containing protein [Bacillota bacterium]
MNFKDNFGKISKSIGDKASFAAKKSSELFEVTKINMAIDSEKEKVIEIEEKIGHLVYTAYKEKENVDSSVLKLCRKIDEITENIASMTKKLAKIKNSKFCSKCDLELPNDTKYCPNCGKNLD